jgi:ribonuclease Z
MMGRIVILGSANAVPGAHQENTHFFIEVGKRNILVDCASNPLQVLPLNGIQPNALTDIIITHFHPDHVSGLPLLLMDLWLLGRQEPISIYANQHALSRIKKMMDLFDWQEWPNFYPVKFNEIPEREMHIVMADSDIEIYASPVQHLIPTIGLRIEFISEEKVVAYSCDTEPCQAVVHLANGADILMHETSGPFKGHTSAAQAAQIASEAGAKKLLYIHYPVMKKKEKEEAMIAEGKKFFNAEIDLARDKQVILL